MAQLERTERPDVAELRTSLTTALMGRYHIGDFLGSGRGGVVFRARHLASKRNVAVKVAWNEPRARSRVLREFSLTSQVVHPNVITMRRIDVPDPLVVVEMPLVSIGSFILWLILMFKAYSWEKFKLPIAGDIAEQKA